MYTGLAYHDPVYSTDPASPAEGESSPVPSGSTVINPMPALFAAAVLILLVIGES